MSVIRKQLFEATASLHRQIDSVFSLDRIASFDGYAAMMKSHAAVVPQVETFLVRNRHLVDVPQFDERMRTQALLADMKRLGLVSEATPMSFLNSRGAIAGILYVLEGSRLGATLIRRRLAGTGADFPNGFLSHGENAGFWQSYLTWLQDSQWSPDDVGEMRDSAIALFQHYLNTAESCFSPHEVQYATAR